ncbi:MAG: aldehyde dehydrogenase family protein, partial [Polyangiales bacterium]
MPELQLVPAPHTDAQAHATRLVARLRGHFDRGVTKSLRWRFSQLDALEHLLMEREGDILEALQKDLGKPETEALLSEVRMIVGEVRLTRKKLRSWMKPERVRTPLIAMPGRSYIYREPLGLVLIIAPWNYPFQTAVLPLVGALGAGNCVVLKPSEVAPHTSAVIAKWIPKYLDTEAVQVVEGGVPETTALLRQKWDHIFYTGNGTVGRIVMEAASKHLTPVTLELGGKSPTIVDETADLDSAAKRIVYGKFFNAGQTCVAPDYVLVDERVHDALLN